MARIKNLPASILDRLRAAARSRNQTFQETLTYFGFEKFLYRLSKSPFQDRFVLKGALVMMTWPSGITRATRDIDFSASLSPDVPGVLRILQEICRLEVEPDGIQFEPDSILLEAIIERAASPGIRARLVGFIGKVEIPLQIDIGFSDVIFPDAVSAELPSIPSY